jgi:MULE transposase domain
LLDELQNAKDETREEKWNYKPQKNKEIGELTGLFFSHLRSRLMFIRYLEVAYIDATFKVNRFNVPLLSIVGTTSLNTTFQIASIFLVGKHEDDYL